MYIKKIKCKQDSCDKVFITLSHSLTQSLQPSPLNPQLYTSPKNLILRVLYVFITLLNQPTIQCQLPTQKSLRLIQLAFFSFLTIAIK